MALLPFVIKGLASQPKSSRLGLASSSIATSSSIRGFQVGMESKFRSLNLFAPLETALAVLAALDIRRRSFSFNSRNTSILVVLVVSFGPSLVIFIHLQATRMNHDSCWADRLCFIEWPLLDLAVDFQALGSLKGGPYSQFCRST